MRAASAVLLLALGLAVSAPAAAPPVRTAEQRQTLLALAKLLGQAHALHRVCAGPADDTWRGRMARLIEVEAPGDAFKAELTAAFNTGFTAGAAGTKDCKAAQSAEQAVARLGADLARKLAVPAP